MKVEYSKSSPMAWLSAYVEDVYMKYKVISPWMTALTAILSEDRSVLQS